MSYNLTRFWHYLEITSDAAGEELRLPLSHCRCQFQVTWAWTSQWEVGGSIELPSSGLTICYNDRIQETLYLLDDWFIVKGYNLGTARWRRCRGQDRGMECDIYKPIPAVIPALSTFLCSPTWKLSKSQSSGIYGGFIIEYIGTID